jgi:hypothetical protein
MSATPAANGAAAQQQVVSPNSTAKLSQHSPTAHSWSDEGSSEDDAVDRSQSGTSGKRKRPLSVSCETYVSAIVCYSMRRVDRMQLQNEKGEV